MRGVFITFSKLLHRFITRSSLYLYKKYIISIFMMLSTGVIEYFEKNSKIM